MQKKFRKTLFISFFVSIVFVFLFNYENVAARSLKAFLVEKSGSEAILISDGYSEYIIDHSYSCYDSQFMEGSTIYIDTYYSPSYGDDIIISGYTNTVCEVTNSTKVNIKQYYVDSLFDSEDKIIVSNSSGKYLVEYGIGCSVSMWRYEGKRIDIDVGGSFLDGIGDTIYLFDSGRNCRVWDAEELSGGSSGGYTPPSNPITTCPINSSLVGTGCVCNSGYVTDSTKTYCVAQLPSCPTNSSYVNGVCNCNEGYTTASTGGCITYTLNCAAKYGFAHGDKNGCYCNTGYEMNATKSLCVPVLICSANSAKVNNQCVCNEGYVSKDEGCVTYTQDCIKSFGYHVNGSKGNNNNSSCNCDAGYQWNSSQTACIKVEVAPATETVEQPKQVQQDKKSTEIKTASQEGNKSYPAVEQEKPISFWNKIFNPIKNFWKSIFK